MMMYHTDFNDFLSFCLKVFTSQKHEQLPGEVPFDVPDATNGHSLVVLTSESDIFWSYQNVCGHNISENLANFD